MAKVQKKPTLKRTPTGEELVGRAAEMVPVLRQRAQQAEEDRGIPRETFEEFRDAGFFKVLLPARYGGYEMQFNVVVDIAYELGRACGSSAWVYTNLVQQSWVIGMKDVRAQDEIWGDNPDAVGASAHPGPKASFELTDGGVILKGAFNFSSGIDFADFNNLQIYITPEDKPTEHRFIQVMRSDYDIVDDWHVTGLAGTGSRTLVLKEEMFVPDYRMIGTPQLRGGATPGSAVNPSPLYRLPFWGIAGRVFTAPTLGMARGMQEAMEEDIASRKGISGLRLAEQPTVQQKIAESGAEIDAAMALQERDFFQAWHMTEAGVLPDATQRARWRRNNSYAGQLCLRATERLFHLAGMRGMAPNSHIQRTWRDVHAAVSQVGIAWDPQSTNYARARFGMPIHDPRS